MGPLSAGEFKPSRWTTYPFLEMDPEIETTAIFRETRGSDVSQIMPMVSLLSSPEVKFSIHNLQAFDQKAGAGPSLIHLISG